MNRINIYSPLARVKRTIICNLIHLNLFEPNDTGVYGKYSKDIWVLFELIKETLKTQLICEVALIQYSSARPTKSLIR